MEDSLDEGYDGPECTDDVEPVAKKKSKTLTNMSMLSFLTGAPKAIDKIQSESEITLKPLADKRDYSKNKHVCMLCANDNNLKDKQIAILCRGSLHQLRRHYERRHANKDTNYAYFSREKFKDVLPINHVRVPSYLRTLSNQSSNKSSKEKQPNVLADRSTSHTNLPDLIHSHTETELEEENDLHNIEQATAITTAGGSVAEAPVIETRQMVQEGIETFIETKKPDFEEKVLSMIENLSKKVDSLKLTKTPVPGAASLPSTTFAKEMESCYNKMKDWKDV
ncbi:Hypothetical predicted protein [Paramuricea clavata]|uniref:Uncharacterized protein n=1 Tax=Paramuricea clavata TaxID=317549 RepID=A0A7D9K2H5_PARCT|nr:Hypothetical predicted protein [Paramuricea clavata]